MAFCRHGRPNYKENADFSASCVRLVYFEVTVRKLLTWKQSLLFSTWGANYIDSEECLRPFATNLNEIIQNYSELTDYTGTHARQQR